MSAKDNLNHAQMKLFDSAGALIAQVRDSGDIIVGHDDRGASSHAETLRNVYARKEREASSPRMYLREPEKISLKDSMLTHGWNPSKPLYIGFDGPHMGDMTMFPDGTMLQTDAHHRLAVAAAEEERTGKPFWVPLDYLEVDKAHIARRLARGDEIDFPITANIDGVPTSTAVRPPRVRGKRAPKVDPAQPQLPGLEG